MLLLVLRMESVLRLLEMTPLMRLPVLVPSRFRVFAALFKPMFTGPVTVITAVVGLITAVAADPEVKLIPPNEMPAVPLVTFGPAANV